MTIQEAKEIAQKGIKVTHVYFTNEEYITMKGNIICFEDGAQIFFDEWTKDKEWLGDGWSPFSE